VSVSEISGFTAGKWSDGLNISTSRHVRIDGGYLRVSDDGVVVYVVTDCPICAAHPIAPVGPPGAAQPADTFDIKASNLTIWNDVAHALFVGHFGDADAPRTISDVTFDKIKIVNFDEDDPMWDGALAIYSGNATLIKNVTFSDIDVQRIEEGRLINIVAGQTKLTIASAQANKLPGRGIDGVTLRNIHYTGEGLPNRSIITGLSPSTAVRNVSIENPQHCQPHSHLTTAEIDVGPWKDLPSENRSSFRSSNLARRVAVVTGANTGIGQGIALALAHAGADIAAVGRTPPRKPHSASVIWAAAANWCRPICPRSSRSAMSWPR
jgi:hypothetical protein